ncbi:hypothetical protein [Shimia sp.]|uniref:hypothetical protein n=1 Tax=Shimia sp. TaxID=1954381 RepID=UPI003B8AF7B3
MKAIAEYFRDLAADDRYFGAEPPTPDAEMLARIAEQEIARRVSARMDQGAIVLSATPDPQPAPAAVEDTPAPAAPVAASVATAPSSDVADVDAAPAEAVQDQPTPEDTSLEEAPALDTPTTVIEDKPEQASDAPSVAEVAEVVEAQDPADAPSAPVEDVAADENQNSNDVIVAEYDDEAEAEAQSEDTAVALEADGEIGMSDAVLSAVTENVAEEVLADVEEDIIAEAAPAKELAPETDAEVTEDFSIDLDSITAAVSAVDALSDAQLKSDSDVADSSDLLVLEGVIDESDDPFAEDIDVAENMEEEFDAEPVGSWDEQDDAPDYEENSIAAKLERIRAVVSRVETAPQDTIESEDEQPELTTTEFVSDFAADQIFASQDADLQDADVHQNPELDALISEELSSSDMPHDALSLSNDLAEEMASEAEEDAEAEAPEETAVVKPTVRPLRARIVRMKKADFEEAVAAGTLEANSEEEMSDDASAEPTSLTPEDEADLLAELAQVEAELQTSDADNEAEDAIENMFADDASVQSSDLEAEPELDVASIVEDTIKDTRKATQTSEPDLTRLMAKADSEMEEPAGKGRRSAIAHLRAAVAATRAEKHAGKSGKGEDDTIAYRDDLASVVRTVPGGKGEDSTEASTKSVATPLKLVAAQRVDTTPAATTEKSAQPSSEEAQKAPRRVPVRPRRVSSDRLDRDQAARAAAPVSSKNSTLSGFIEYANSVGANQLPESIEAAAAYLTFVQGLERFSRPMLMRMSREVNIPQFTREEGLRSFGQLLRDKKIEKRAGGRFAANATINYKPRDREAG